VTPPLTHQGEDARVTQEPGDQGGVGLVVISHSRQLAEGVVELAGQMAGPATPLVAIGGAPDGSLGTDADRILDALVATARDAPGGVVVLADLGSAVLAASAMLETLEPHVAARVRLSHGPIAEGAVLAAVEASIGGTLEEVLAAADAAGTLDKGVG
jgi:phosphoenolpyruvate---glycerone phosphotransferase subunit DhaM